MNPAANALVGLLDSLRQPHTFGHRCEDGSWYNSRLEADRRTVCPVHSSLNDAIITVAHLAALPRAAADDPAAVRHVLWRMSGFDADALDGMDQEQREGWLTTARDAILGLASWLDSPPVTP